MLIVGIFPPSGSILAQLPEEFSHEQFLDLHLRLGRRAARASKMIVALLPDLRFLAPIKNFGHWLAP